MNEDTLKGQWTQLKGKTREKWGKLTNDDLDLIQGRAQQLVGRIQERYGVAREEAERQLTVYPLLTSRIPARGWRRMTTSTAVKRVIKSHSRHETARPGPRRDRRRPQTRIQRRACAAPDVPRSGTPPA